MVHGLFATGIVVHRRFEEEAQEPLYAASSCTCCEVYQQYEIETNGSRQYGVSTEEVYLYLHGIAHPAEDIDIIPRLLVVVAWRVVVYAYLMIIVAIEVGLVLGLQYCLKGRELAHLLCTEVCGLVEHQAVPVAQDIRGEPSAQPEAAGAQYGCEAALHQRLPRLEVLACNRHLRLLGQLPHCGDVHRGVRRTHHKGRTLHQRCVGIAH